MKANLDGSDVRPILEKSNQTGEKRRRRRLRRRRRQDCSCPELSVSDILVLDQTRPEIPELFLSEESTGAIWAADLEGCRCRRVVDASSQSGLGELGVRI